MPVVQTKVQLDVTLENGFSGCGERAKSLLRQTNGEQLTIDEIIVLSGQCGRYQIMVMVFMMCIRLVLPMAVLSFYFIGHSPSWTCVNSSYKTSANMYTNMSSYHFNNATYLGNYSKREEKFFCNIGSNQDQVFDASNNARCNLERSKWRFAASKSTIVTEFDLVCGDTTLDAIAGSVTFVGWGLGSLVAGILSDKYGRKKVMFPSFFLLLLSMLMSAFVKSLWQLIVLRLLVGVFMAAPALNSYVMLAEFAGPAKRAMITNIGLMAWTLGLCLMTLKAYLIDSWRILMVACSVPYFCFLALWFFAPESVRWLNGAGLNKEAERILCRASRMNGKPVANIKLKPAVINGASKKSSSYLDLLSNCSSLKLIVLLGISWFTTGMAYYGLALAADGFGGSMYGNFLLSSIIELPSNFGAIFLLEWHWLLWLRIVTEILFVGYALFVVSLGRKRTGIMAFGLTAFSCLGVALAAKSGPKIVRLVFGVFGKLTTKLCFSVVYIWSIELFPTVVRTQAMGIFIVTSRAGAGASPFVVTVLRKYHPALPFIVMGGFATLSTALCCCLEETRAKPTRERFEELLQTSTGYQKLQTYVDSSFDTSFDQVNESISDASQLGEREDETDALICHGES